MPSSSTFLFREQQAAIKSKFMVVPLWTRDHGVDSSRYGSSVARRVASPTVGLSASVRANDWHPVSNLLLFSCSSSPSLAARGVYSLGSFLSVIGFDLGRASRSSVGTCRGRYGESFDCCRRGDFHSTWRQCSLRSFYQFRKDSIGSLVGFAVS